MSAPAGLIRSAVGLLAVAVLFIALVAGPRADAGALLQANGGKIAFSRGNYEIYVMNPDGSGQTRLTQSGVDDDDPAWSPDGSRIAFVSDSEIHVMNADGREPRALTTNQGGCGCPAWSPDGSKIVFWRDQHIFVMNADGSGQRRLTGERALESCAAWSPDGTKIAFGSNRDEFFNEIYVVNADGSELRRLTNNMDLDSLPAWSPDGSKIAFVSDRDGNFQTFEIYVMNADGSSQRSLTRNLAADDSWPDWSRDGRRIAFDSDRDGNYEIYVMNADGSGQTNLTRMPRADRNPAWSPDGSRIAFVRRQTLKLGLTARSPQRVLRQKGVIVSGSCDEACTLKASGAIAILGQRTRLPLRPASGTLAAPRRQTLKLGLSLSAQKRLATLLGQGKRASASVTVRAVDRAGNASTATRAVAVRR